MPAKIPATVITGFLGAGKTTLIRNLLAKNGGKRIALVINEFGDIGVDGEVLRGCGDVMCAEDDIIELSNGCICCTVADDFVPTMKQLLDRAQPPDHIIIETSGLALPQPLVRAFNWPEIRTRVTVDGVITVVDGPATRDGRFAHDEAAVDAQRAADASIDHETPLSELFEDQLACADMVVVSKTDQMSGAEVEFVLGGLTGQARGGVRFLRSGPGGLGAEALLGLGIGAEDDLENRHEVHHHHHHDDDEEDDDHDAEHEHGHDEFESFAVTFGEIADARAWAERVAEVIRAHDVLRLKGFAAVAGKPMRLVVQAVGPRIDTYFDRPFGPEPRATRLVVIGEAGLDRAAITAALTVPGVMAATDWKAFWDGHYGATDTPWVEPDPLFTAEAAALAPGRALDLGCGEGAASLWLAARGWRVTAIDFAASGIATLKRLAGARGLSVDGMACDILDYRPAPEFDLVTLGYMHLEPEKRRRMHAIAAAAVRPGGTLIYLGFDREGDLSHVDFPPVLIATQAELRGELAGLRIERLETVAHEMDFGDGPARYPVMVARAVRGGLTVERDDPQEARALLEASHAMMVRLFNPEANHFLGLDALRAPEISFFVARLDGRVAGCGALARRDGYGEIKSMFVDPEARRAGVGAALMSRLEAEAAAQALPLLRLETGNLLEAAHALYARCGFEICGPFGDYPAHPQSVFMEKRLA